ncbi:fimbrial protein [Citrobacter amalonaticus]|uniref:fimbrial protein n=1 Tax=Citrobacter amalonaticus TaxID=35703 RepID=UPI00300CCA95
MKKSLIAASMVILSGSAFMAHAESTGTITFNGMVTDTTCDVSVNGQGPTATVQLPTVSSTLLAVKGDVTGRTQFNMELTNCTLGTTTGDTVSQVSAFFQDGATVDPSTGHLKQQEPAGATNVSLQLLDGTTFAPIKVGDSSQITDSTYYAMTDTGDATGNVLPTIEMPYAVEYFADGQATPGPVSSSVVYNLMYK